MHQHGWYTRPWSIFLLTYTRPHLLNRQFLIVSFSLYMYIVVIVKKNDNLSLKKLK